MPMFYFFYYLPLGFDLRGRRRCRATWALVAASVLGFLLWHWQPAWCWSHYEDVVYVPAAPRLPSLVLNAYAHADWLHLLANMLSLVVFGPPLEARLGSKRLLLLYHLCNLGANLVQGAFVLLFLPGLASWGILGASGAIAGLMGAFLVRLHFARLKIGYWAFLPFQAYARAGQTTISVVLAVALWFLVQLALVMTQVQGGAVAVAAGSHLGGLASGSALALLAGLRCDALAEQHLHCGRAYLERAEWYAAQGEFVAYVRRQPDDSEGHLSLARTYRLTGTQARADDHYRRACELSARARLLDHVGVIYDEARRDRPDFVLDACLQLQLAQMLERTLRPDAAERVYMDYVRAYAHSAAAPLALYRAARLARRRSDDAQAADRLDRLLARHPDSAEANLARTELVRSASAAARRCG